MWKAGLYTLSDEIIVKMTSWMLIGRKTEDFFSRLPLRTGSVQEWQLLSSISSRSSWSTSSTVCCSVLTSASTFTSGSLFISVFTPSSSGPESASSSYKIKFWDKNIIDYLFKELFFTGIVKRWSDFIFLKRLLESILRPKLTASSSDIFFKFLATKAALTGFP